ncbi:golgin candidate 2-like [Bidens hawaiensis]|uniref:golgin candidate 2-like n=1 Tax=Bidens hawaiensis TaxID=980011 RepID=UPI004048F9CD
MSGWISSKLKVAETLLQQIDQQAAESLGKNEPSPSADDHFNHAAAAATVPYRSTPPFKHQLKTKTKKPPQTEEDYVAKNVILNPTSGNNNNNNSVNPGSTDWTQLLSAPTNPPINRLPAKRQLPNFLASHRKPLVNNIKSVRTSDAAVDNVNTDAAVEKHAATAVVTEDNGQCAMASAKNEQLMPDTSVLPVMASSSNNTESLSASDGEMNVESESDSSSDSEREREERRKRREKLLAEKAAAKAIEAIKDRENLVARLEGEKQSLEKIIDERAKQQAHEASQLQMTMMETMEAVDLEKQKHNNTRMEALLKLAKLETTNAELAKSLAAAQWGLEEEVKWAAELHRQIEFKEASHEELTSKKKSDRSGNKLTASRGVEFKHEILEAEHAFVTDKVGKLQEKAKTLETAIQETRKEIENPSEVEVELKCRLSQLTDHLIQKQAQVEALSSEKAMLMFRIEAVSRSLDESMKTSKVNDIESGVRFQEKGEQKHIIMGSLVRQLDSIFWAFLRRNPMGKAWCIVYLVCLHLWVLYIFRSHSEVSDESGAVISLENISNTGV